MKSALMVLHIIIFALWTLVVLCNFYVGYMQLKLFNKGLVHAHWRWGTSILNAALIEAKEQEDILMINRAKVVYRVSTIAFVPFLVLAFWVALR
jgi:prepilin signal peptidase PulO-like enzyme (type II secretory pathway)